MGDILYQLCLNVGLLIKNENIFNNNFMITKNIFSKFEISYTHLLDFSTFIHEINRGTSILMDKIYLKITAKFKKKNEKRLE